MSQPGYGYQPGALPSAPPLLGPSSEDDMAPPSYEEAIGAHAGGGFSGPPPLCPAGAGSQWQASDARADPETGSRQTDTAPAPPAAAGATGTGDDPPSYQSLFGQIKEAKEQSSGICDFISKLFLLPLGCLSVLVMIAVVLGLVFGLPVTLVTVGALFMFDCPVASGIPVWMVAGGVIMIVYIFWVSCTGEKYSTCQAVIGVLFYLAWYIAGCVLIYPTWQPPFAPRYAGDLSYCDYTPMLTAFITINLLSVLTGVMFCTGAL